MSDETAAGEGEDQTAGEDQTEGEAEEGAPVQTKKFSGKKIVLFIVLPLFLLLGVGGGGAYYYFFMMGPTAEEVAVAAAEKKLNLNAVYYDLPEMLVNLNNGSKKANYLKIRVAVELDAKEDVRRLESVLPRVIDNFQVFLRELRLEDLSGSAGLMRLKEELLIRINLAAKPVPIRDILFKEMLVQ